jgi:PAS domain S-box-containing protein
LLFTDAQHHLLYPNPLLNKKALFPELTYRFTWVVYVFAAYSYLISIGSIVFLIFEAPKMNRLYRQQLFSISFGALFPILATLLALLGFSITPQRDPTPFTTVIGNLIIAWGLFRYRVFNLLPIAREFIIENMEDAVFVLDGQQRVVDVNRKALELMNDVSTVVIGRPAAEVCNRWPEVIEKLNPPASFTAEFYQEENGKFSHFDVKSTILHDRLGAYLGMVIVIRDVTSYAELQWQMKTLNENLEQRVLEQTREIYDSYETTLEGWAKALELRDKETEGHSRRVIEETVQLARALDVPEEEIIHLRRGAILHDIGKMGIPDEILRKPARLTREERRIIEKHPETALRLLENIPYLKKALDIPYSHQERWDGSGYPLGLKGEQIPLAARIFAVVDVWDALLSDRIYSKAWSQDRTIEYIKANSAVLFDPRVVSAFLKLAGEKSDSPDRTH